MPTSRSAYPASADCDNIPPTYTPSSVEIPHSVIGANEILQAIMPHRLLLLSADYCCRRRATQTGGPFHGRWRMTKSTSNGATPAAGTCLGLEKSAYSGAMVYYLWNTLLPSVPPWEESIILGRGNDHCLLAKNFGINYPLTVLRSAAKTELGHQKEGAMSWCIGREWCYPRSGLQRCTLLVSALIVGPRFTLSDLSHRRHQNEFKDQESQYLI